MDIKTIARWWAVGLAFYLLGLGVLYLLTGLWHLPNIFSTLLAGEALALLRFWLNERWVFRANAGSLWKRLWQYHVANAGGFAIWWVVANVLPIFSIHYLVASTIGTGCSVGFSMLTHFFWVWRHPAHPAPVKESLYGIKEG